LVAFTESIVQFDGLFCRKRVCLDATFFQYLKGLWAYTKPVEHAFGQHDYLGAVTKQLDDVGGLYAWLVGGAGFVPIPFPCAARENLGVPKRSDPLNVDPPPNNICDTWRRFSSFRSTGRISHDTLSI
jgi:hypothetical protein